MSSHHRRTRIYGANYDIGESYYKKQLNDLDNKGGSYRNSNAATNYDPLNENKGTQKVSFLCPDSDYKDNGLAMLHRNLNFKNLEDPNHKSIDSVIKDFKNFDDFDERLVKESSKFKFSENSLENRAQRHVSPDALNRSYLKYSLDKEETPLTFDKKVDNSFSFRSKYVSVKEKHEDDFEASQRINATRARLHDLEEEMSSLTKKQNEREKRNHDLKKILYSSSNNEVLDN